MKMNLIYLVFILGFCIASEVNEDEVKVTNNTAQVPPGTVHEFSNWSFVWAFGWLVVIVSAI